MDTIFTASSFAYVSLKLTPWRRMAEWRYSPYFMTAKLDDGKWSASPPTPRVPILGIRLSDRHAVCLYHLVNDWPSLMILGVYMIYSGGVEVRELILGGTRKHLTSMKTKHRNRLNQLWSSHSRRFVPELRFWHSRNKLNHLVNRPEPH
jgi:hypothetical protein